jgi:23S rRNA (guanosine2251-2'-O)-methyltransferase
MDDRAQSTDAPVYGIHPVEELLSARRRDVERVYFEQDRRSQPLFELLKICRRERMAYSFVPEAKLDALAGTRKHQGVAAFCCARPYDGAEAIDGIILAKAAPLFLVAASIEDPGNLGAIIRSCVCLGADALLLERKNTVPLNASTAKSSAGMLERLKIVKPRNLEGLIKGLADDKNFSVIGAEAQGGFNPSGVDFKKPTVLITGGEHRGIPPYLQRLCAATVTIPMAPEGQSLNASVAVAVLLYEVARQRRSD